jgi:hypothetical protein
MPYLTVFQWLTAYDRTLTEHIEMMKKQFKDKSYIFPLAARDEVRRLLRELFQGEPWAMLWKDN